MPPNSLRSFIRRQPLFSTLLLVGLALIAAGSFLLLDTLSFANQARAV